MVIVNVLIYSKVKLNLKIILSQRKRHYISETLGPRLIKTACGVWIHNGLGEYEFSNVNCKTCLRTKVFRNHVQRFQFIVR